MAKQRCSTDALMSQIGARIRFLRLETGLSLRSLAQKANCSTATIMHIELGRSAITSKLLRNIARGLDVQPFDLLNVDTQNDVGYLIEKMRQDPATRAMVNARLETWGAMVARPPIAQRFAQ